MKNFRFASIQLLAAVALAELVVGCGGSNKLGSLSQYEAKCQNPRTGTDPFSGRPFPDRPGTTLDEKKWLKLWTDALYLWYREVPDIAPDAPDYPQPVQYFNVLKTPIISPNGRPKDRFHYSVPTTDWESQAQGGVESGYGAHWAVKSASPPRQVFVVYIEPNSPADSPAARTAGFLRGAEILTVDGVDMHTGTDVATLNRGLYPSQNGESHTFGFLPRGSTTPATITLTSAVVNVDPVPLTRVSGQIGYVLFNNHLAKAEAGLFDAVTQLQGSSITDLIVDLRYNGGGYLDIANQFAFMIAGASATNGKFFEKSMFNDKYPTTNPITGQSPIYPFRTTTLNFSLPTGRPLPALNLRRVFFLVGFGTCSASESLINGLRGVDVEVFLIGNPTCGKPYGFYPQDNCGTTYFSIQLQTVNYKGFGDYADGFTPAGTDPAGVAGCMVADDLMHDLGDPLEARLAAALNYIATPGTCPAPSALSLEGAPPEGDLQPLRPPWTENRIMPSW